MKSLVLVVLACGLAVASAWAQPAPAERPPAARPAAERLSAEDYVRPAQLADATVSPGGGHIAMLLTADTGRRTVAVARIDKPSEFKVVAAFSNADVDSVHWVNDRRLVYTGSQPGYIVQAGGAGIFAVDLDGSNQRQLVAWVNSTSQIGTRIQSRVLPYGWFLYGTLDDGSDDVLMHQPIFAASGEVQSGTLVRLNTSTGVTRALSVGAPDFATRWLLDAQGELRVAQVVRDGREQLHWRAPGTNNWQLVDERALNAEDGLEPLALEGPEELLVATRVAGRDTEALHVYNLRKRQLDPEAVAALAGFDLDPALVMNRRQGRVLGLHTRAAQPATLWFDEALARVQRQVDGALPGDRRNRLLCGRCQGTQRFLVHSSSDREAGELLVFDAGAATLSRLGRTHPWLPEDSQGRRTFHRVPARDGLPLPVVLTHPPGQEAKAALPAVMLVHGGPWVRGSDRLWSAEAQFLASRGWRVIEVEFRGSTGFGWRHFRAGWQQWGLAMQDDLADVMAWAAQEGWADAGRACIFGSSYGGYAALMGPIRHPGAWRCAASYAGVTDIQLLFNATWGDLSAQFKRHGLPALVGEPQRDAERLERSSPLRRVAEIKVPVLLGQGVYDRRVPPEHADRFEAAARRAGVRVERVNYDEGHSWVETRHHADFMRRLEAFIARAVAAP